MEDRLEQRVLADIIVSDYDMQVEALMRLDKQDFNNKHCQNNFIKLSEVVFKERKKVDIFSYREWVKDDLDFGDISEVIKLTEGDADLLTQHVTLLKQRTYKKRLLGVYRETARQINAAATLDSIEEAKTKALTELGSIEFASKSKYMNPHEFVEQIDRNMEKGSDLEGYSWGIYNLDAITSGIILSHLIVLGGLKKTGKSRLVINTRERLAEQKVHSVFLSLEMPEYQITKLSISRHSLIEEYKLRHRKYLNADERCKYQEAKKTIQWDYMKTECVCGLNVAQVIMRIRRYSREFPNCVIFIDYLQRLSYNVHKEAQELQLICNKIADAAREYNVSIILLSQLSNLAEREGVSIGALKGSGGIGESADVIILLENLYRKQKLEENKNKMDLYLEQRYGESGKIELQTDLSTCMFADLAELPKNWV